MGRTSGRGRRSSGGSPGSPPGAATTTTSQGECKCHPATGRANRRRLIAETPPSFTPRTTGPPPSMMSPSSLTCSTRASPPSSNPPRHRSRRTCSWRPGGNDWYKKDTLNLFFKKTFTVPRSPPFPSPPASSASTEGRRTTSSPSGQSLFCTRSEFDITIPKNDWSIFHKISI